MNAPSGAGPAMSLADFIRSDMAPIIAEWTTFAKKAAPPDGDMSDLALADHAQGILCAIANDMETQQSKLEQFEKSQGDVDDFSETESAAAIHGRLRQASHFSLSQLSSEFRALRATVLRRWLPGVQHMSATTMREMVRFNEAIDQVLAESIKTYSARADRTRDLFLAVLGHDLRAPLASIALAGETLVRVDLSKEKVVDLGHRTRRSAMVMGAMVTDLLGYTRVQMGAGMPTTRTEIDAQAVCNTALDDARAMYPANKFVFRHGGQLRGMFDAVRLQQLVTNLLMNAAQHSNVDHAVTLQAQGTDDAIVIRVRNAGAVIAPESLGTIFQAMVQLEPGDDEEARPKTSLGLGLFIAQQTAAAHDGTIAVTSDAVEGTVFTVDFPRAH